MKKYPVWKCLFFFVSVFLAIFFSVPNLYKDVPTIDIAGTSPWTDSQKSIFSSAIKNIFSENKIEYIFTQLSQGLRLSFNNLDDQIRSKAIIDEHLDTLCPSVRCTSALNLYSSVPAWMTKLHAYPMYLGLDLRGGVHFLLSVDTKAILKKYWDSRVLVIRQAIREKKISILSIQRSNNTTHIRFLSDQDLNKAKSLIHLQFEELNADIKDKRLVLSIKAEKEDQLIQTAIGQNISILHNRINSLGIAEPMIQQQGKQNIVVELSGIQDIAQAKRILGRTATLEMHLVDDLSVSADKVSRHTSLYPDHRTNQLIPLKNKVLMTGEHIIEALPGFDNDNMPAILLTLDNLGTRIFRDITKNNIGKRIAIVLSDSPDTNGVVLTAPRINESIPSGHVQITGSFTMQETNELSILLKSGTLAAPMKIAEEKIIGPRLGEKNIAEGFRATWIGLIAIAVFICFYYRMMGLVSVISLTINLFALVACLSVLQATLTLPGIAAIALTLGMAIDSNVLINERIREELRTGAHPILAIEEGYSRAWTTIVDSNITTLIAGLSLLVFGSGSIRGFAIVHSLGILTSLYSAVFVSRTLTEMIYGHRKSFYLSAGQTPINEERF